LIAEKINEERLQIFDEVLQRLEKTGLKDTQLSRPQKWPEFARLKSRLQ